MPRIDCPLKEEICIAAMDAWTMWASPSSIAGLDQQTLDAVNSGSASEFQRAHVFECLEAAHQYLMNVEPSVPVYLRRPS